MCKGQVGTLHRVPSNFLLNSCGIVILLTKYAVGFGLDFTIIKLEAKGPPNFGPLDVDNFEKTVPLGPTIEATRRKVAFLPAS